MRAIPCVAGNLRYSSSASVQGNAAEACQPTSACPRRWETAGACSHPPTALRSTAHFCSFSTLLPSFLVLVCNTPGTVPGLVSSIPGQPGQPVIAVAADSDELDDVTASGQVGQVPLGGLVGHVEFLFQHRALHPRATLQFPQYPLLPFVQRSSPARSAEDAAGSFCHRQSSSHPSRWRCRRTASRCRRFFTAVVGVMPKVSDCWNMPPANRSRSTPGSTSRTLTPAVIRSWGWQRTGLRCTESARCRRGGRIPLRRSPTELRIGFSFQAYPIRNRTR